MERLSAIEIIGSHQSNGPFDPTRRTMTLRPLETSRLLPAGKKLPLVFDEDAPLTACHIDGRPGVCMLDTGNAGSTIVTNTWAQRDGLTTSLLNGIDVGGERISRATIAIGPFIRRSALVSYGSPRWPMRSPFKSRRRS